ncbi:glycoside hydrolase family 15 protein [Propioniciclava soli]|uniref:Glycoside hydrolase family 15 protein n=1 Tax=Propioniciclava soli TaxID=2775081 RepID=A0ABZ3C4I1_9ACTN
MTARLDVTPSALRDHALIADGERGAVLDPHRGVVWLCVPRWHNEPVFSGLLGGPGRYVVAPADPWHVRGGSYLPGTLVWRGRWTTTEGVLEADEALGHPADIDRVVLLHRIRAEQADLGVRVELQVCAGFGGEVVDDLTLEDGVWTGRGHGVQFRWQGAGDARPDEQGCLVLDLDVRQGREHDLVLELSRSELPRQAVAAQEAWESTKASWARTVPAVDGLRAADEVRQSYAVLAGLTSRDHGMVAAATMALPERARAGRNYDYRYAWIRDQCYAGQAIAALGPHPLLESALTLVTDRLLADGTDLKPAYRVDGTPVPDEHHAGLPGYPGGGDVVGNWVNQQFQLDAIGEALSLYAAADAHGLLDARRWQAVRTCVRVIEEKWPEPEAGIWELDDDRWTHSRLTCVAGLRSIAKCTSLREAASWSALADTLLASIAADCVHPDGRWQRSPSDAGLDAALVLPPVRGALPADDPRSVATRRAVGQDLDRDGFVYRFRQDGRPLGDAEGAFTLCGFTLALAHAHAGRAVEAVHYYERARSACATSGLFTEEYDVAQRQLRGNFPQAFVHAMFIEATVRLDDLVRRGDRAGGLAGAARPDPTDDHHTHHQEET